MQKYHKHKIELKYIFENPPNRYILQCKVSFSLHFNLKMLWASQKICHVITRIKDIVAKYEMCTNKISEKPRFNILLAQYIWLISQNSICLDVSKVSKRLQVKAFIQNNIDRAPTACYDTNKIDILKDHRTKILNSDVGQRFVVSEAKLLSGWPRCNSRVLLEEYFLKAL